MALKHYILSFSIAFMIFIPAKAQLLEWDWAQNGGGNSQGFGMANFADNQGNVYVAGYFSQSITFGSTTLTAQNPDYYSLFVVKYNPNHDMLWAYGGQNGQALGISVTEDGFVYITGFHTGTTSFGSTTFTTDWGCSAFILKLNSDGDQMWVKNIHTAPGAYDGYQFGRNILNAPNGDIYVAGDFSGNTLMVDSVSLENPNVGCFGDIWFACYTASGNLSWVKRLGGYGADEVAGLAMDGYGDIYMTGNSYSSTDAVFDTIIHPPSNERFFTAKFSPSGSIYWARFEGNSYADKVNDIYTDADGNSYITGKAWLSAPEDFGNGVFLSGQGNEDQFIVKYDRFGNTLWAKSVGGPFQEGGNALCTDDWGNICVASYTQSSEIVLENDTLDMYGIPLYITRYNSDGLLIDFHTAETPTQCFHINPGAITSDAFGNLYVVGGVASDTAFFGNVELLKSSGCSGDYFVARLGNPNSDLSVVNAESTHLKMYPNPVSDKFIVLVDCADIEVFSVDGECVLKTSVVNNEQAIDVSHLKSGMYLLRVYSEEGSWVDQFLKE